MYAVIVVAILLTGKGIRLGFCLYAIYFLHWLFLHATTLPVPDNMVGLFPEGVFTLAKRDRPDFWFSGHVANAFVIALATSKSPRWLKVLAWVFFAFQILLVLSTRTHYTIDVLGALFVAYTVHHFSFGATSVLKRWTGMPLPQETSA